MEVPTWIRRLIAGRRAADPKMLLQGRIDMLKDCFYKAVKAQEKYQERVPKDEQDAFARGLAAGWVNGLQEGLGIVLQTEQIMKEDGLLPTDEELAAGNEQQEP